MCSFRRLADSIYFEAAPANRSEEHTSELQSQSNLVCRLIISEEHTSELQSQSNLVCRLLLEKKKRLKPQSQKNPVRNIRLSTTTTTTLMSTCTRPMHRESLVI